MQSRPESDETLVRRMLPSTNADQADRAHAWAEWQSSGRLAALLRFIHFYNHTTEPDEDILQEALLTAYLEVERGRYVPRPGVPFTAYVKGIARNKLREARRHERYCTSLDDLTFCPADSSLRQIETMIERNEQHTALQNGLSSLPLHRQRVLEQYIQGASTQEIASRLAMSEELVRQHKSRGLRSLRQISTTGSLSLKHTRVEA
jgi:RNA polymerase sigma factor (sigma-70 family)